MASVEMPQAPANGQGEAQAALEGAGQNERLLFVANVLIGYRVELQVGRSNACVTAQAAGTRACAGVNLPTARARPPRSW